MSTALTSPARPTPLQRFWRRVWLSYRIRQAEKDHAGLCEQIQRDLAQAESITRQIAIWRAESAYHQEPQEGT